MKRNFQPEIHPDADQLSVFVEGVATAREQERMLAHLAECAECRKAVFLMQPHQEAQRVIVASAKGWKWSRLLLPVGLPAAALAGALVAVLIHIRAHSTSGTPQQNASVRQAEVEHPGTTALPTVKPAPEPSPNSEQVAGSGKRQNGRSVTKLQQLQPADTKQPASQNVIADTKELPGLKIERADGKDETFAGVSGHITDPTGASVPGATVTLRDAIGKTRQTTTGADGSFYLAELAAGRYELTVTARGFKTSDQSIELNPNELAMLQPKLAVGSAAEQVTVEATAQGVQTDSSEVSSVVSSQQVSTLATNGRSIYTLVNLAPVPITVSRGKRSLSLDDAGNLLVSRNGGKKWKKVNSQWTGKVVRIELTPPYSNETAQKAVSKNGSASHGAIFQLTTDSGAVWTSKDGAHWRQQ